MITLSLVLAIGLQDPLFPTPRFEEFVGPTGMADFNLDGLADLYSSSGVLLSDGSLGGTWVPVPDPSGRAAVGDFDSDGYLDVATSNHHDEGAHINLFDPVAESFTEVVWDFAVNITLAIAAGDVNGDGNLDLYHSSLTYTVDLGDGTGGMLDQVPGDFGTSVQDAALGDVNEDGLDDLVASPGGAGGGLWVALATGGGALANPALLAPGLTYFDLDLLDWNGDGHLDILTVSYQDLLTFLGDGTGNFAAGAGVPFPADSAWNSFHVVDYDDSGTLDVVMAMTSTPANELLVAYGDGAGGFTGTEEIDLLAPMSSFAVGDVDGDGDLDLGAVDFDGSFLVEREGDELLLPAEVSITLPTLYPHDTMAAGDLDGDGDEDLLIVTGSYFTAATTTLARNDGGGQLTLVPGPTVLPLVSAMLLHDFGGDGTLDILGFPQQGSDMMLVQGDGQGGFGPPMIHDFWGEGDEVAAGDWTSDGLADVLAPTYGGPNFYRALPGYDFAEVVKVTLSHGGGYYDVAAVDLNLDGDLDVATRSHFDLILAAGDGDGGFTELQAINVGTFTRGLGVGDFNVDGLPDALLTSGEWFEGVGGGLMAPAGQPYVLPGSYGFAVTDVHVDDVDGDGDDDAMLQNGVLLLGDPAGLTLDRGYYSTEIESVVLAELTGDGLVDLVVQHFEEGYLLLENLAEGCPAAFTTYGEGCPGSGGLVPALEGGGCPSPGGSYTLDVTDGPPNTAAFASFGLGQGAFGLPNGCTLLLDPWLPVFVGFTLDGGGAGSLGIAIAPGSPAGVTTTAQVGLFDPGAQDFYTLTNGVAITIH